MTDAKDKARDAAETDQTSQQTDKPFMYAIQSPDGSVYMDEVCVCEDPGPLNDMVTCLNDDHEGDGEYKVVPVYLAIQPAAPAQQEPVAVQPVSVPVSDEPVCQTCNGHGLVGGMMSWGDGQVDSIADPCPDCQPAAPAQQEPVAAQPQDEDLLPYLRQFMHNDGSGFVAGYDKPGVDRLVSFLRANATPNFETADDLIAWLDTLHETEGGAITNRKWGVAQIAIAALAAQPVQDKPQEAGQARDWMPMETAPKDGTMLRLLVQFDENATEDSAEPCPTIGANSFVHSGEDVWQFAGWNWEQDCFDEGVGTPVGWLPLLDVQAAPAAPEVLERQNADLLAALRQANSSLKYALPYLQIITGMPEPDCTPVFQAILDSDFAIRSAAAPSAPSVSADKPAAANAGCQDVMAQLEKWEPSIIDLSDAICEFETELYVPERGMLKAFRHLLDCYPWARPTATSASESADPLQFLADQAQELDMGYGPNACPTCLRSGSGEADGHMDIDREGARFWHRNCANHLGGVMREIKREPDKSLLECQHCGKCGYYPVGGVGRICAAIAAQSKEGGAA